MSVLTTATGIILRTVRHGETSLILMVFTREYGRLSLMAKGARGRRGLGSALEILTEAQFVFYRKAGRELQLLKEWNLVRSHSGLREAVGALAVGSAVVELLARCLKDEDPHGELYEAAASTLLALAQRPVSLLPVLWAFEIRLVQALGFALQLPSCVETARPLVAPLAGGVRYRLADGSFLHPEASPRALSSGELSAEAFAVLRALAAATPEFAGKVMVGSRAQHELTDFLARYLETHLPVRGQLRSLQALHWGEPKTRPTDV